MNLGSAHAHYLASSCNVNSPKHALSCLVQDSVHILQAILSQSCPGHLRRTQSRQPPSNFLIHDVLVCFLCRLLSCLKNSVHNIRTRPSPYCSLHTPFSALLIQSRATGTISRRHIVVDRMQASNQCHMRTTTARTVLIAARTVLALRIKYRTNINNNLGLEIDRVFCRTAQKLQISTIYPA
jgi:hypothetical protein